MAAEPTPPSSTTSLPDIDDAADEAATLQQFLRYQRVVFVRKVEGLTTEQANQALAPSDLTLAKLARHLSFVEDFWASVVFAGEEPQPPWSTAPWEDDPDWEMTSAADHEIEVLVSDLVTAWSRADAIYDGAESLGQLSVNPSGQEPAHRSLRWILVHLIEEYARHLGHADYLRQAVDGTTGD
ncbi:MAG: DinB family protein [Actinomycetota bacterium]